MMSLAHELELSVEVAAAKHEMRPEQYALVLRLQKAYRGASQARRDYEDAFGALVQWLLMLHSLLCGPLKQPTTLERLQAAVMSRAEELTDVDNDAVLADVYRSLYPDDPDRNDPMTMRAEIIKGVQSLLRRAA